MQLAAAEVLRQVEWVLRSDQDDKQYLGNYATTKSKQLVASSWKLEAGN
jgi:hypothetical protein